MRRANPDEGPPEVVTGANGALPLLVARIGDRSKTLIRPVGPPSP